MGRKKIYKNEEELKEANRKKQERWRMNHPKENLKKVQEWQRNHPMEHKAMYQVSNYKRDDRINNRGECTITTQWMIENVYNGHCLYCGKTDWRKLGLDRIDNSKPHTLDNVVVCCEECNKKRGDLSFEEFLNQCT